MKQIQKLVTGVIFFSLCIAAWASPSIVGKWKGHIDVDWSKAQGHATPQQIEAAKKQLAALKIIIEFKSNKTFIASGAPGGSHGGTWTVKGNEIDLMSSASKAGKPQVFQLAKNGKTMSTSLPGGHGSVTLTRV